MRCFFQSDNVSVFVLRSELKKESRWLEFALLEIIDLFHNVIQGLHLVLQALASFRKFSKKVCCIKLHKCHEEKRI